MTDMDPDRSVSFTKGHGTENDFVLVPDLDGGLELSDAAVRYLADRRAGIGADGVIRVVRSARAGEPQIEALSDAAEWFMDYRNADGSIAEMCGNGTRVFAAYLRREGLEARDEFRIATRAGLKTVRVTDDGYAVDLGPWLVEEANQAERDGFTAVVALDGLPELPGLRVDMGNPHTVVVLPPEVALASLDLTTTPRVAPNPEHGTNVEFVHIVGPGHIAMRVVERGVGETRSCGTGAAAAAVAVRWWQGPTDDNREWIVDVPGGRLRVFATPHGTVELAGPAVLVADGVVALPSAGVTGS